MAGLKTVMKLGPIIKKKALSKAVNGKLITKKTVVKKRSRYVRQAAKMSTEQFKKFQVGMDDKWPAPKYMEIPQPGRSHTCYRDETYMQITRWTEDTKIQYRPHAKAPGSKSHTRYEKYSKARTVKEALALGSWPADWCWDYERGFIQVVGGKLRDEPIDASETYYADLSDVDRILAKWFIREAARILGVSIKEIAANSEAKDDLVLRMRRTIAESTAKEILTERAATGRKLTDADVLACLRSWGFRKNITRINVAPEGAKFVLSDTMGLVSDRTGGIAPTRYTLAYPNVSKVLCDYLQDHIPADIPKFTFTSINVNKNYAGRRHRDGNNVGPSVIKAFGNFTGGQLQYFPNDNRSSQLEDLPESGKINLDLKKHMAVFDGKRAHQVTSFAGERYSLVWFTCPRNHKVHPDKKAEMLKCGFQMPTPKDAKTLASILTPAKGYDADGKAGKAKADVKNFITWVPKDAKTCVTERKEIKRKLK